MEDNARKFIIQKIDAEFLKQQDALCFDLGVDWLVTSDDNEQKLVYKKSENADATLLLVSKMVTDGSRHTDKKKISQQEYDQLLTSSTVHLEKKRYEFSFFQNNYTFAMKYDEFMGGALCMIEVDGADEYERGLFDLTAFPYPLKEVTGDIRYYGYRAVNML